MAQIRKWHKLTTKTPLSLLAKLSKDKLLKTLKVKQKHMTKKNQWQLAHLVGAYPYDTSGNLLAANCKIKQYTI